MRSKSFQRILVASLFLAALVWACGDDLLLLDVGYDAAPPAVTPYPTGTATTPSGSSSSGADPFPAPTAVDSGVDAGADATVDAATDAGTDAGLPAPTLATVPTDANLKVAFIGDTGTGANLKDVLALIRREKAKLVMFQGDLNYTSPSPATEWFATVDNEINATFPGSTAPVTIPYFASKGNHDIDWNPGYATGFDTRLAQWGVVPQNANPAARNYSIVHKGLKLVMTDERSEEHTSELQSL